MEGHLRLATRPTTPILEPMVKDAAGKYAAEKKITPRDCSKES